MPWVVELDQPMALEDFGECVGIATGLAKQRQLAAIQPHMTGGHIPLESNTWTLHRVSRRYIDLLCGVLAGKGYQSWAEKVERRRGPDRSRAPDLVSLSEAI